MAILLGIQKVLKFFPLKAWIALFVAMFATYKVADMIIGPREYARGRADLRTEIQAAPVETLRTVEVVHDTLSKTVYRYVKADTVIKTIDLSGKTRAELEAAAQPFTITKPVTITDEKRKVGVHFNMSFEAQPMGRGVSNLTFSNIVSTYPKETRTVTKTIFVDRKQHLFDLYLSGGVAGYWHEPFARKMGGLVESGLKLNVGEWHFRAAPLAFIFMQSKSVSGYSLSAEWTVTE